MDHEELIDAQFNRAVEIVQSLPKTGPIQTAYEDKLEMYSLFKQATVGDVESTRPAMWDVLGRAKWDAWEKQRGLDQQQAKWLYVQTLQKVLRRYSDRTVARDLVRELDSYGTDPSNLVMSGSLTHHSDDDSSSSSSVVLQSSPLPISRQTTLLFPPPGQPDDATATVLSQSYHDAASDGRGDLDSEDEAEKHDVLNPEISSPPAMPPTGRSQSALSSHMRYRTPTVGVAAFSPAPTQSAAGFTPSGGSQQPLPRYSTPSAFATHPNSLPPAPPTPASYPNSLSYVQHPTATGSTVGYHPDGPGRASSQPTPSQRTPLERAIEGMQTSLAALHERMDSLEASTFARTPPLGSAFTFGPRGGSASPVHGGSPSGNFGLPFDPHQTGAWSIILVPLSRVFVRAEQLIHFLLYPPNPSSTTARLIIVRRLLLDASFLLFVLGVLKVIWRATGLRRREVGRALMGVWHAISGKQVKVLVEKAVGHTS